MSYNYTNVTEHIIAPTVKPYQLFVLLVFSKFDCFIKSVS